MPPGADAVTGQHRLVGHARRGEALHHELIDLAGRAAWCQLVIGSVVDVADQRVLTTLLRARRADHGTSRLMAGIALYVGHVIGADRIARRKWKIAFSGIGNRVALRVENSVCALSAAG